MLDTILLLIRDPRLRQLYHELLLCENIEIVPIAKVENAIIIETFDKFNTIVIYPDDIDWETMQSFLKLQKKVARLAQIRLILLTSDPDQYSKLLSSNDVTVNIRNLNLDDIAKKIIQSLRILTK
jgi:hypothetical protein